MTQEEMLSQMNSMLQSLQQVNASQAETIIRLTRQNESLQNRLNELTAQVAWLNRQLFGHKSEKRKHPIKYPFSLLYFHCTFAFAILHELLTYFHYDTRTI